ncbi:MAG: hypothetical protein PHH23_02995, partial [Paludibacteraceae bacterium]|nr:hypothetical protein [Paludibacteraceae bacterium]
LHQICYLFLNRGLTFEKSSSDCLLTGNLNRIYMLLFFYRTAINLDILIIDALRDKPHLSHESTGEALLQIARIAPKKAYLIHMSHGFGLHAAMEHKLPENVHIAYDRLKITI